MRHRVKKYKNFKKKDIDHRNAMLRNLLTSFFTNHAMITTEKQAKAIVGEIDRLINVANNKTEGLAIREIASILFTKEAGKSLMTYVAPKFKGITSGFTRITPIKYRDGDAAKIVKLELVK